MVSEYGLKWPHMRSTGLIFGAIGTTRRAQSIQRGLGANYGPGELKNQRFWSDFGPWPAGPAGHARHVLKTQV